MIEAWALDRPVQTSDSRGIREPVGEAAVLVDPRCPESIADGLHRLWTVQQIQSDVIARGRTRLSAYTPADYGRWLLAIMAEASARGSGGDNDQERRSRRWLKWNPSRRKGCR